MSSEASFSARAVAAALLLALACGPVVGEAGAAPSATAPVPAFSGARAMSWLRVQCALGPRNPGSPGQLRLRRLIKAHADSLGLACATSCFTLADPYGDGQLDVCNLVISAGPPGGQRLWIAAHYDTRPRSDRDPDPQLAARPLIGANDGASGVAVLLHLAELLAARPPARGVDLLFLDAEDYGREGDPANYCLGAAHLAAHWREFGSPLAGGSPAGLVLLDMVGKRDLAIPMEGYSLRQAGAWTRAVFARAAALGLDAFVPVEGPAVWDDHVPFLKAGIPAVDLIDFDYAQWHTSRDTPEACAPASLEQVGRLVTDLCYRSDP
ncbi:MAG: M28 family peptidase [Candidatus Krumholzibacteriia bacterium]